MNAAEYINNLRNLIRSALAKTHSNLLTFYMQKARLLPDAKRVTSKLEDVVSDARSLCSKLDRQDILYGAGVSFIIFTIFSPLIFFGGFHHSDDFLAFRTYSPKELSEAWYSNANFEHQGSNSYRPLMVWNNFLLYTILGFNDKYFMSLIVILNGIYALLAYHLARHFLKRPYAAIVGLTTVLVPQTLFKFTFASTIYTTFLFGFMLIGYDFLISWYKSRNKRYLYAAIIAGVLASLYKESGLCLLLSIPFVVIAGMWHDKSKKLRDIILSPHVWFPLVAIGIFVTIRHYAIILSPERFNPDYPARFEFHFNMPFVLKMFHSMEKEIVAILRPTYDTFFVNFFELYNYSDRNFSLDPFILVAIPVTAVCFLVNWKNWKSKLVLYVCILESIALILYLGLIFLIWFSLILEHVPAYKCFYISWYYLFYILLATIIRELWIRKDDTPVLLLFIFLAISIIPLCYASLQRNRIVSNTLSLVLIMSIFQFIQYSVFNNKVWIRTIIMTFFGIVIIIFAVKTLNFILITNCKYPSPRHISAPDIELSSTVTNSSFEQGMEGWSGPSDSSRGWPGEPVFTTASSDEATDGEKSLLLSSENHILGISKRIQGLKKGQHYRLSVDAKKLVGTSKPSVFLYPVVNSATQLQIVPLQNGWKRYYLSFIPTEEDDATIVLYCSSRGERNTVLYDNLRLIQSRFVLIGNGSFEQGLEGWRGLSDSSRGWSGEPVFTTAFSDEATDGEKSLLLGSENHIAGIGKKIQGLKKGQHYRLSVDAKKLVGTSKPNVFLYPVVNFTTQLQIVPLQNGWKRYYLSFIPTKDDNTTVALYCSSHGEKNIILYDNLRLRQGWEWNLATFLQYEYEWPSWLCWPVFDSPWH